MIKRALLMALGTLTCAAHTNYWTAVDTNLDRTQCTTYQDYVHRGKELQASNEKIKALAAYKEALKIRPSEYIQCKELGNCLLSLGNEFFDRRESQLAIDTFNAILEISPNISAAYHNIAFTLAEEVGDYHQAVTYYHKALKLNPDNIESHFCLALSLLATGNLLQGFKEYECRWKRYNNAPRSFTHYPLTNQLHALHNIAGKRIMIRVEQGLGDTLQFIRYAQLVKEKGAIVIAEVQKPLVHLLALCSYLDEIVLIGDPAPPYDYQIPLLNLPVLFHTTLETIPTTIPYLRADPQLINFWRHEIKNDTNFKVGICWQGDPTHGANKFMPLNYFEKFAQIPGISIYCLQQTESTPELSNNIKKCATDFDNSHGRFMDTAALMKSLDLVITVDTSIAHLAGGLGIQVWTILPFPAEWRWLQQRNDSPWYSTMRVFRQIEFGNWNDVYEELVRALESTICEKK